jgi:predicted outer membrane repeat protein
MRRTLACSIAVSLCLLLAKNSAAATWHIRADGSGDAPTIQAAVDASADGDTILVAPGTYTWTNQGATSEYGMIYVQRGQDRLVIRSEAGPQFTVLDAQGLGRVLFIQGWNYLTLDGFTIRNGIGTVQGYFVGGGITMHLSYEVIRNCIFEWNSATAGGALWCGGVSAPQIIDCEFRDNSAERGGAIYWINSSTPPLIRGCVFVRNTSAGSGGAIQAAHNGVIIENSVFARNVAATEGGALYTRDAWACRLTGCTLADNSAPSGSAVYALATPDVRLERCIVARGGEGAPYAVASASVITVSCTDTHGNAVSDAFPSGVVDSGGNFSLEPQFCGQPGSLNFMLNQASPCLPGQHPAGSCGLLVGAWGAGCGTVRTEAASWGRVKSLYHR